MQTRSRLSTRCGLRQMGRNPFTNSNPPYSSTNMRHEPAGVRCNWGVRFANPDTGRGIAFFVADDPASDDGKHPVEVFQRRHVLIDETLGPVIAFGLDFDTRP